jgi:hypothetical protein
MLYQLSYASSLGNMSSKARYPHIRSLSGTISKYHNGNPRASRAQALPPKLASKTRLRPPLEGLN